MSKPKFDLNFPPSEQDQSLELTLALEINAQRRQVGGAISRRVAPVTTEAPRRASNRSRSPTIGGPRMISHRTTSVKPSTQTYVSYGLDVNHRSQGFVATMQSLNPQLRFPQLGQSSRANAHPPTTSRQQVGRTGTSVPNIRTERVMYMNKWEC